MTKQDFSTTIVVNQTPKEVFTAINNPRAWWSGEFKGNMSQLNDEFTYHYKDLHYTKQRVVEMIPHKKVVWLVTESTLNFIEDKTEWKGTKIIFDISKKGDKTQLRFTHEGIHPGVECFDNCSVAWTQLIQEGLYTLITTGKSKLLVLA